MTKKILIVEDDQDFATSLKLVIDLLEFSAVIAGSAEEAYELMSAEHENVRVGFFDIKLPQEDGITCFEKIRSQYPDFTGVFMTGFRDEETLNRAREAGAAEILLKPFRMSHFLDLAKKYATIVNDRK